MSRKHSKDKSYCCVPQCKSSGFKDPSLSFHRFPNVNLPGVLGKLNEKRKREWIRVLKIGKEVTDRMPVCSKHFKKYDYILSGIPTKRPHLKNTAVPSVCLPVLSADVRKMNKKREKAEERAARYKLLNEKKNQFDLTMNNSQCSEDEDASLANVIPHIHGPADEESASVLSAGDALLALQQSEVLEIDDTNTIVETYVQERVDVSVQVKSGDFPSPILINISGLKPAELKCLTGIKSISLLKALEERVCLELDGKPRRNMPLQARLVLTMMRIKLDLSFVVLSVLFGCTSTTCNTIFIETVHALAVVLRTVVVWPSKDEVMANMPICFKKYTSVRAVVDCTEIFLEKPKCLRCQVLTYSQYTKGHTAKYMVCTTPGGLVSYISKGYGGRASDKCIFQQSMIIEWFEPYTDSVMVDKGFLIDTICEENGINVIRPPFLKKKKQLAAKETVATRKIARARVHVERAIQRLKIFKLLRGKLPWRLLHCMDDIVIIAAGLTNLSSPILGEDKYIKE